MPSINVTPPLAPLDTLGPRANPPSYSGPASFDRHLQQAQPASSPASNARPDPPTARPSSTSGSGSTASSGKSSASSQTDKPAETHDKDKAGGSTATASGDSSSSAANSSANPAPPAADSSSTSAPTANAAGQPDASKAGSADASARAEADTAKAGDALGQIPTGQLPQRGGKTTGKDAKKSTTAATGGSTTGASTGGKSTGAQAAGKQVKSDTAAQAESAKVAAATAEAAQSQTRATDTPAAQVPATDAKPAAPAGSTPASAKSNDGSTSAAVAAAAVETAAVPGITPSPDATTASPKDKRTGKADATASKSKGKTDNTPAEPHAKSEYDPLVLPAQVVLPGPAALAPASVVDAKSEATIAADSGGAQSASAASATPAATPNLPTSSSTNTTAVAAAVNPLDKLTPGGVGKSSDASVSGGTSEVDRVRFVQRVARAFQTAGDRGGTLKLRLSPPELGSLKLDVNIQDGVLSARVQAETPEARNMLIDNLPALRERLAEHDIKVEHFDVDLFDPSAGGNSQQPKGNSDSQQQAYTASPLRGSAQLPTLAPTVDRTATAQPSGPGLNVVV